MAEVKHIKVDNWGVYFLQRLKLFFNKTDYCDLTLQFRDYAQLKVHRLVLSACTEYFELLERTCETYDDCLVMPDDLQADVVVPIVNFMYTGQLEYDYSMFERLYATAQAMNIGVLTKLLDAQKAPAQSTRPPPVIMNERPRAAARTYARQANQTQSTPARPTRYELPDGLDGDFDGLFEGGFADLSYDAHHRRADAHKRRPDCDYDYHNDNSSRKFEELKRTLQAKRPRITLDLPDSSHLADPHPAPTPAPAHKPGSLNHAKIIHEVLKKYPHLVKSSKNIKLKIVSEEADVGGRDDEWIYVPRSPDVDSMASLVALGVENTSGPWLCLLCGTPSKALKFLSYRAHYRHLIDQHKQKVPPKVCEYCGFKSGKRNHLLHHMYTKHDVPPPPNYRFPRCNRCPYVALTDAFLIKHKLTHVDAKDFSCSVCGDAFKTRPSLLQHIQLSGHKVGPDRRISTKCVYCSKVFLREANLYTHLKSAHRDVAKADGVVDDSDDDMDDRYVKEEHNGDSRPPKPPFAGPSGASSPAKILNAGLDARRPAREDSTLDLVDVVVLNDDYRLRDDDEPGTCADERAPPTRPEPPPESEPVVRDQVVVMNEHDFQMACSQSLAADDGSKIVFVYDPPAEEEEKRFVQYEPAPESDVRPAHVQREPLDPAPPPDAVESVESWAPEVPEPAPHETLHVEQDAVPLETLEVTITCTEPGDEPELGAETEADLEAEPVTEPEPEPATEPEPEPATEPDVTNDAPMEEETVVTERDRVASQTPVPVEDTVECTTENGSASPETSAEVHPEEFPVKPDTEEESIENIQKEIKESAKEAEEPPSDKITSLIDEWDDGESQAEGGESRAPERPPARANIDRLVSDWDDDDDKCT